MTASDSKKMSMDEVLRPALIERERHHLYRRRRVSEMAQGSEIHMDGKSYVDFCSNDYLGLANHPKVIEAMRQAASKYGVGSGASHLVSGHSFEHHALEEELAVFTGRNRALLFSTGYMANMGAINALVGKGDAIFEDKLNHASLLDAGLASGARFQRFLHNDISSLEKRLQSSDADRKLIVVDGVFSMDGDLAPLPQLGALAEQHNAWLMVDDAHGFGCLGNSGAGIAEHFNLTQQQLPILMGTLGKGAGSFGAFVAGSETLIETLIQQARTYIYTTALPPAVAAASRASLKLIAGESWRRDHLNTLIARFRQGIAEIGLPLMSSSTAIQPLMLGSENTTLQVAQSLAEQGFLVGAIRPPTVAKGKSRLRITLSAVHSEQQVDDLISAIETTIKTIPVGVVK